MGQAWRRAALALCALVLAGVAWKHPVDKDDVVAATQFSVAFFATLLTGEAVIFALTFSAASSWPSLRAIHGTVTVAVFRLWLRT
jgi:hypothetical protein